MFLTMEAMVDAAVHLGFPRDTAAKLVTATIKGSAAYAQSASVDITTLRSNVSANSAIAAAAAADVYMHIFYT